MWAFLFRWFKNVTLLPFQFLLLFTKKNPHLSFYTNSTPEEGHRMDQLKVCVNNVKDYSFVYQNLGNIKMFEKKTCQIILILVPENKVDTLAKDIMKQVSVWDSYSEIEIMQTILNITWITILDKKQTIKKLKHFYYYHKFWWNFNDLNTYCKNVHGIVQNI